jgi:citrate synthase
MSRGAEPSQGDYASAAEAMRILRVRRQTLYAYVSRGWVRSIVQPGLKDKLYLRDDLVRLNMRSLARSGHGAVAASAMNWGEPILPTSITEITPEGPRYRGHLAAELVNSGASFEAVADLLWTGQLPDVAPHWPVHRPPLGMAAMTQGLSKQQTGSNLLEAFAAVILGLGLRRGSVADRMSGGQALVAAREIMQNLVSCCGFMGATKHYVPMRRNELLADALMRALSIPPGSQNRTALQAILILLADHELSPGTLTARVVASAGGTLHSCLASALCATSGLEVGRIYERVDDLLGLEPTTPRLISRARQLLAKGLSVPGFDHPAYPKGDPRAAQLLEFARNRQQTAQSRAIFRFIDQIHSISGLLPRQELAVVVLTRAMGLPRQAALVLLALARMAGWVAHVQEQRAAGTLLRPRAKFIDVPSGTTPNRASPH